MTNVQRTNVRLTQVRRGRVLATGAGAAALALILAAPAGAADLANPTVTTANGKTVLKFLSHTVKETFTPKGGKPTTDDPQQQPGVGDKFSFVDDNSQGGTKIGTDSGDCTIVKSTERASIAHCLVPMTFANGTITVEGDAEFAENSPPFKVPITAGTGAYAGATGSALVEEVNDADSNLTITYSIGAKDSDGQVAVTPAGGANTGGGSTAAAGVDPAVLALGGLACAAGAGLLVAGRRVGRRSA